MDSIRTKLVWMVGFLISSSAAFAEEPMRPQAPGYVAMPATALSDSPRIQFAETNFDFGKAVGGEVVKHDYIFTNSGSRLLVISNVKSTCGCTSSSSMSRQVEPGKTGTIPLEFFTENYSGPVAKTVTVISNDTNQPPVALQIKGTIWRPIEVTPKAAVLSGLLDSPSNSFTVLNITNKQDEPLTLFEPASNNRLIAAELKTNRLGQEYQLIVKLVPPLGSGNVFGEITLKTSAAKMPLLKVSAFAVRQQVVTVMPAQLTLPAVPIANSLTQYVSIRSIWANPLTLSDPAVNAAGVSLEIKELQPGRYFTVVVGFPPGFKTGQNDKVELSIKSNHPQFPVIKVPVVLLPPTSTASKPVQAAAAKPATSPAPVPDEPPH